MAQLLIFLVLVLIAASGYITLRDMPRSTHRSQVMKMDWSRPTRDTGFGG